MQQLIKQIAPVVLILLGLSLTSCSVIHRAQDADRDGVVDSEDQCPQTPRILYPEIDATGCPIDKDKDKVLNTSDLCTDTPLGVAVDAAGCPLDSDHDGVADYLDLCSNTPPNTPIFGHGCPIDGDEDGVPDNMDKCPKTPLWVETTPSGCWMIHNVHFDFNKIDIQDKEKQELDKLAEVLNKNQRIGLEIRGHTDIKGSAKHNQQLSEKRAEAVRDYLIAKGISTYRLVTTGFGAKKPILKNTTEQNRAKNRRGEMIPF